MKNFDKWNEEKKRVHTSEKGHAFFFHEREIWWCAVGANVGVETDGKHDSFERPVLVIRKFNKEMFWGVPLTSHERKGEYYTKITGEHTASWVIVSQLRTWSSKRLLRRIGMVSKNNFLAVAEKIRDFIKIDPAVKRGLGGRSH